MKKSQRLLPEAKMGWFNPQEFMNTYQEFHAWIEGFCETFCFWRANYEPSKQLLKDIKSEHHYYVFGRAVGFISLVGIGLLVVRALKKIKARDEK